jgi:hypothetical protein
VVDTYVNKNCFGVASRHDLRCVNTHSPVVMVLGTADAYRCHLTRPNSLGLVILFWFIDEHSYYLKRLCLSPEMASVPSSVGASGNMDGPSPHKLLIFARHILIHHALYFFLGPGPTYFRYCSIADQASF